jgi:hypothetical protein
VPPSIAEGPADTPAPPSRSIPVPRRPATVLVGVLLVLLGFLLYAVSNPVHWNTYNHFVWQADAFLHGRAWFIFPIPAGGDLPQNDYLRDVYPLRSPTGTPDGRALLPFPPLPALVLLPFVAVWGLATDQEWVAIGLAAIGVGLAWWALGGLRRLRTTVRALATVVFATGTAWWWAAAVGSTWYLAHLVAVDVALVAVGIALRHDPAAAGTAGDDEDEGGAGDDGDDGGDDADETDDEAPGDEPAGVAARLWAATWPLDRSQVLAGLLLGIAVTARLPMIFAAPWFVLVGGGGTRLRRTASAAVGGVLPVAALLVYTWVTTGSFVHPGYDYQYRLEVAGYPTLGYHASWDVEDPRYIPQNLGIMFGSLPRILPDVLPNTLQYTPDVAACQAPGAERHLFDPKCPIAIPVDVGTSILLSAPGLLLALFAIPRHGRSRLAIGTAAAVLLVAVFNLAHFSQGWVQWGYRFSLDFIPFLLPLVALGAARPRDGQPRLFAFVLLAAGLLINLWGVTWGQILGW